MGCKKWGGIYIFTFLGDPIGDGVIHRKNHEPPPDFVCSIWQLVKNWLDRNEGNHILHKYSPRISNTPFCKISKSWNVMKLDITMILDLTLNH